MGDGSRQKVRPRSGWLDVPPACNGFFFAACGLDFSVYSPEADSEAVQTPGRVRGCRRAAGLHLLGLVTAPSPSLFLNATSVTQSVNLSSNSSSSSSCSSSSCSSSSLTHLGNALYCSSCCFARELMEMSRGNADPLGSGFWLCSLSRRVTSLLCDLLGVYPLWGLLLTDDPSASFFL